MSSSALSRRLSEFVGVALFAGALIWIISLASYSASDPVWFFNTGANIAPANFAGRVGAFLAELSYQVLGYAAYVIPMVLAVIGWHYFWCRAVDAAYTKLLGAGLLFSCSAAFLALAFGTVTTDGKEFRAGGVVGERLAAVLAEYLNRTGSIILILTLLFLAVILSTQFSFGRLFSAVFQIARDRWAALMAGVREQREEKRRDKQRQDVLKKHLARDTKELAGKTADGNEAKAVPVVASAEGPSARERREEIARAVRASAQPTPEPQKKPSKTAAVVNAGLGRATTGDNDAAPDQTTGSACRSHPAAAGTGEGADRAEEGRVHAAAVRAARRTQGGAEDRRTRADGGRTAARGEMSRVRRRSSGPRR